ncbi:MAG: CBS domain-containing protein [Candidatus Parvarchaeota archaeon]|nr:CBS domain-containing protein [Candidatus Jingweiarchaeum tengchongense]MCW1298108.1 CBS domain-containing protein [Candidatus Jingweiarchaeum tengchongense]MCW1300716.1 CBS domain-containing protein [Candidatus Jingweiarchaeum tengchongense]MCW1305139.1 CBS domain-containing protein [Candidatus Jingweiarchaeum tengchongense]MCW1305530.1 CBS domain-containing protein [Candidatus Jingweiarchaeum tengchongense]
MIVRDIMVKNPITIKKNKTIKEAIKILKEKNISFIPVTDEENHVIGTFHESDLIKLAKIQPLPTVDVVWTQLPKDIGNKGIEEIMVKNPITISEEENVFDALAIMDQNNFRYLPVVNVEKKLVGIIKLRDIIHCLLEQT